MDIDKLYFSAQGRINRQAYWEAYIPLLFVGIMIEVTAGAAREPAISLLNLVIVVPGIMLSIKRCHDRAKPGWWLLINLIPYVGALWLFFELGCFRGSIGDNKYGPDPLLVEPQTPDGNIQKSD
jgi:uncharacterized membrane protein YhaH (DUF805 family)